MASKTVKLIDLDEFRSPGVGVFVGRDRAVAIRDALGIQDGDSVELRVPGDVYCLAAGFADTLLWNLTLSKLTAPRLILAQIEDAGRDTYLMADYMPMPPSDEDELSDDDLIISTPTQRPTNG